MNKKVMLAIAVTICLVLAAFPVQAKAEQTTLLEMILDFLFPQPEPAQPVYQPQFEYEIDHIKILNPVSRPELWGLWIVRFETKGEGNLEIEAYNGTFFGKHIEFIRLSCSEGNGSNGDVEVEKYFSGKTENETWVEGVDNGRIIARNWNCDSKKGRLVLRILATGRHYLRFSFLGETAYAENLADCTGTDLVPCDMCDVSDMDFLLRDPSDTNDPRGWQDMTESGVAGSCPPYENHTFTDNDGYTFCPSEGDYDAQTRAYAEGDAWEWEPSSWFTAVYNVNYDSDSNWCGCNGSIWFPSGSGANSKCCGDDISNDDFEGDATDGCCCDGSPIATGDDDRCSGHPDGTRWCIDGDYCTDYSQVKDASLPAEGTDYTLSGDDIVCGVTYDESGDKCDDDYDAIAEGLAAGPWGSGTCAKGTVCKSGSDYFWQIIISNCPQDSECDTDVTPTAETPRYVRDGTITQDEDCCSSTQGEVAYGASKTDMDPDSSCSTNPPDGRTCDNDPADGIALEGITTAADDCCTGSTYFAFGTDPSDNTPWENCGTTCTNNRTCYDIGDISDGLADIEAGLCVSGNSCDVDDVCINGETYYGAMSSCATDDECDANIDTAGYSRSGTVTGDDNCCSSGQGEVAYGSSQTDTDPDDSCSATPPQGMTCDDNPNAGIALEGITSGTDDCCASGYTYGSSATDADPWDTCAGTCASNGRTCADMSNIAGGIEETEEGICTGSAACTTGGVYYSGGTYYAGCSDSNACDTDVNAGGDGYVRNGYCCSGCLLDGSVAEDGNCCGADALCSDATYNRGCYGGICLRDNGQGCTNGDDCGSDLCVNGFCRASCDGYSGYGCSTDGTDYSTSSAGTCYDDLGSTYGCDYTNEFRMDCGAGASCDLGSDASNATCDTASGDSCDSDAGGDFAQDGICSSGATNNCNTDGFVCLNGVTYYADEGAGSCSEGDTCDDSFTDGEGKNWTFRTDYFGRIIEREDPIGRVTRIQRDLDSLPTRVELPPNACDGVSGWINSTCYYFSDGDDNENTCDCIKGASPSYWNLGGETSQTTCCDDGSENRRTRVASGTMDNGYISDSNDDACCLANNDCVNNSGCYDTGDVSTDVDNDGDNDYCNAGTWDDCNTDNECPAGQTCVNNNCNETIDGGSGTTCDGSNPCFYLENSTGVVARFDQFGYVDVKGGYSPSQSSLSPPSGSFTAKNSTGDIVLYIDNYGNLATLKTFNVQNPPTPSGNDDLILKDSSGTTAGYIDGATGNMYFNGSLHYNSDF